MAHTVQYSMALAWVQQSAAHHVNVVMPTPTVKHLATRHSTLLANHSPRRGAAPHVGDQSICGNLPYNFFVPSPSPRHRAGATKGPFYAIQI